MLHICHTRHAACATLPRSGYTGIYWYLHLEILVLSILLLAGCINLPFTCHNLLPYHTSRTSSSNPPLPAKTRQQNNLPRWFLLLPRLSISTHLPRRLGDQRVSCSILSYLMNDYPSCIHTQLIISSYSSWHIISSHSSGLNIPSYSVHPIISCYSVLPMPVHNLTSSPLRHPQKQPVLPGNIPPTKPCLTSCRAHR